MIRKSGLKRIAEAQRAVRDVLQWATAVGAAHWRLRGARRPLHHSVFQRPAKNASLEEVSAQVVSTHSIKLTARAVRRFGRR